MKCLAVLLACFVTLPAIGQGVKATAYTTNSGAFVTNIVRNLATNSLLFDTNQFLITGTNVSFKILAVVTNESSFFINVANGNGVVEKASFGLLTVQSVGSGAPVTTLFSIGPSIITLSTNVLFKGTNVEFYGWAIVTNVSLSGQGITNWSDVTNYFTQSLPASVSNLVSLNSNKYVGTFSSSSGSNYLNDLGVFGIYAGDGTFTNGAYFYTNAWAGPSNSIDLRLEDQYYDTLTPLSITGFANKSNTVSQTVVLTIRNLSSTNVTCFMAPNVRTALFTNSFTIAPTSEAVLSMKYSPSGPRTNAITQAFYP